MNKTNLIPAPIWVRMAAAVIRHLPAGRYRAMNEVCRRPTSSAFLMPMPAELGGFLFECDLRDVISREVCFTGRYEPQETSLVQSILRPGMTFVDVGANWGYFTLLAAHLVGEQGKVVSLEPDPRLFPVLNKSIARNQLKQVIALQAAAASEEGTLKLAGFSEMGANYGVSRIVSAGDHECVFAVRSLSLDSLFDELELPMIDLMKMDIEGFEGYALMGLKKSLADHRVKRLLIELHPEEIAEHGHSVKSIVGQLRDFGYHPWLLDHSRQTSRRAAYDKNFDLRESLLPLAENTVLDDWPHMLWTLPESESLW